MVSIMKISLECGPIVEISMEFIISIMEILLECRFPMWK